MASSIVFKNYRTGKVVKTATLNSKAAGRSISYKPNENTGKLEVHTYFDNKIVQRITMPGCSCTYEAR